MNEFLELFFRPEIEGLTYSIAPMVAGAAISAAGGVVKALGGLFGRKKKRRAAQRAERAKNAAMKKVMDFKFNNAFEGMQGQSYDPVQSKAQQMGSAVTASMPSLGDSQSYEAEGYTAEGYTAQGTDVDALLTGSDTGLTNEFNNLQVSTAGAEMAAQEADQSLAASQDLAAQAGTGAGGATALAAAAAKSKASIAADIDKQVKQNEMRRAEGEMKLQRDQLSQQNLASQFDLGQQQFNAGQANQAAQFSANAANQASQFNAGAQNQAAMFGAQAANQFALQAFNAEVGMEKFNAGAQNQFTVQQAQLNQQIEMDNARRSDSASQFEANQAFQADQLKRGADMNIQGMEYGRLANAAQIAGAEHAQKSAAYQAKKNMLTSGLMDIGSAVGGALMSKGKVGEFLKGK